MLEEKEAGEEDEEQNDDEEAEGVEEKFDSLLLQTF